MINIVCMILSLVVVILAICLIRKLRQEREMLVRLNNLIRDAIDGKELTETYEEKQISKIEVKFLDFLEQSNTVRKNIAIEEEKTKELISDISHQTKTPIANLRLYTELLMEENLPESAIENTKQLSAQVDRLFFLIDTLIKLSRLERGVIKLNPKTQSIKLLLETIWEQFDIPAKNKNLSLIIDESDYKAVYDLKWTAEAVGNIIDNAIKYTDFGFIKVIVVSYEMFIKIDVSDTGIGISKNEREKIFHRFYRSNTVIEKEGLGIGLYLSRKIMSSQGGYIKVSENSNEGSVFSVFIPKY